MDLPADVAPYKRTPTFDATTTPRGLLADHRTAAGVWGLIVVEAGTVCLTWEDDAPDEVLDPERPGVIEPRRTHRVAPSPDARFHVVFHRRPG